MAAKRKASDDAPQGEITRSGLRCEYRHHAALPAEKMLDLKNSDLVRGAAASLSGAPLTFFLRRELLYQAGGRGTVLRGVWRGAVAGIVIRHAAAGALMRSPPAVR
jgi:hypothetical protein